MMMFKRKFNQLLLVVTLALILSPLQAWAQQSEEGGTGKDYHLGPGDSVHIQVFGEEDLTRDVKLGADGRINYAFVGQIELAGQTLTEVEQTIHERLLGDYLVQPRVSVTMAEYRPFFIKGEVNSPGSFSFQPGLTVSKAISLAGGLTERASDRKIYVIRDGMGEADRIRVGLDDPIEPGDTIDIEQSFF